MEKKYTVVVVLPFRRFSINHLNFSLALVFICGQIFVLLPSELLFDRHGREEEPPQQRRHPNVEAALHFLLDFLWNLCHAGK